MYPYRLEYWQELKIALHIRTTKDAPASIVPFVAPSLELPPFSSGKELYKKLWVETASGQLKRRSNKAKGVVTLPGLPRICLDDPSIGSYLQDEYLTEYLDAFAPHLWLVATQRFSHISSLTHQIVRGRNLVITEDPKLHLLWYHDRVFIKPIPSYLLSHAFWTYYLTSPTSPIPLEQRSRIISAAKGYLRTWAYLIQHRSDFALATSDHGLRLIPRNITYGDFMRFMAECSDHISDGDVSLRYHFGELRLSRINLWGQVFFKSFSYHKARGQYSAYFSRYFGLILFLFAFFSTALSAMQVMVAASTVTVPIDSQFNRNWDMVLLVSGWFSAAVLLFVISILLFLALKVVLMIGREAIYAVKAKLRKKNPRNAAAE